MATSTTSKTAKSSKRAPAEGPTGLQGSSWRSALKRTLKEFKDDKLSHWAAALTYYGVLSLFPAIIALVSILGLLGQGTTQPLIDNLSGVTPGPARDIVTGALEGLQNSQGKAGFAFAFGLAVAIWSASGYVGAFMDASNAIWDVEEGRPIWKKLPVRLGVTVIVLLSLVVASVLVVVTGPVAEQAGTLIGAGDAAVTAWNIAKWPVLFVLVSAIFALLYWASPNVKQPGVKWVSPGGILAVVLWVVASVGFAFYVANFGSYDKTYGSLGGVIAFLVWLWITNIAILLGAEFNAELERGRQIEAGHPADEEPYLPLRDEPRDSN